MAKKSEYTYRGVGARLDKALIDIADEIGTRIRPMVRDELENTYRNNIYASRKTESTGKYRHTSILERSVYAVIKGDTIKVEIPDKPYPSETEESPDRNVTTRQVYKWLVYGTTKNPKYDYYPIENHKKRFKNLHKNYKKRKK